MAIKIRAHLCPFSHQPGTKLLVPKSPWKAVIFPSRLEISNLETEEKILVVMDFDVEGPVKLFTALQDLERSWVRVSGQAKEGFFSYRLFAKGSSLYFYLERSPEKGLSFSINGRDKCLKRKESLLLLSSNKSFGLKSTEKIHFGCFKKQDWELMKRRLSLAELLPFWFQLGNGLSNRETAPDEVEKNPFVLRCRKLIQDKDRIGVGPVFIQFFQSHFEGIFCSRHKDTDYQGFRMLDCAEIPKHSSLELLSVGARLIRSLFVDFYDNTLALLPCLPKELHAGRFTGVKVKKDLILDIEWSKKILKRVVFYPQKELTLLLSLQKDLRTMRLSSCSKKESKNLSTSETIFLQSGKRYLLDRFMK